MSNRILATIAILLCLAGMPTASCAGVAAETNDLLEFEYQEVGANEEEAVRLACIRAVHATVGRLLFSDFSLQGRDLLEPYIQKNWQKFVASSYVLERRFERDGFGCRIRVQTFPEVMHRDLVEKRFLYRPRLEPYKYVFMAQTFDGRYSGTDLSRRAVIETLLNQGYKVYESGIQVPPNTADVMADPSLFAAAREAAQRIGAEVIVAGRADTGRVSDAEILYAKISTFETHVRVDMIRADDGSLLGSAETTERASDADAALARDESVRSATESAVERLVAKTAGIWRSTVLDQSTYSIMLGDVTPEELESVQSHIRVRLGNGTTTRVRSFYGNVAVVSIDTPRAYAALERAILDFKSFDLRIADRQGRRVTVDVHH